jgi:hypothetical protein
MSQNQPFSPCHILFYNFCHLGGPPAPGLSAQEREMATTDPGVRIGLGAPFMARPARAAEWLSGRELEPPAVIQPRIVHYIYQGRRHVQLQLLLLARPDPSVGNSNLDDKS